MSDGNKDMVKFIGASHPLKTDVTSFVVHSGTTISEILKIAQPDPLLLQEAHVFIDGVEIAPGCWDTLRPDPGSIVNARIVPYLRGGGGGGKNPLRMVMIFAIMILVPYLGPLVGAALGFGTTALIAGSSITMASIVGGAIVSTVGMLITNAIAPVRPPKLKGLSGFGDDSSPALFIEGGSNRARHFSVVPSVLGFYKYFPPLGSLTFTESIGDKNRFRLLLAIGLGPLEFSNWKIGDTPLETFEDYDLQERSGYASDLPLTNFTNSISETQFTLPLKVSDGWQQRTSGADADELSIDLAWPSGLVRIHHLGGTSTITLKIRLEFRKVGEVIWIPVIEATTTIGSHGQLLFEGSKIVITSQQKGSIRHGIQWLTPEIAQYDVRIMRTDPPDEIFGLEAVLFTYFDTTFWTTLRTISNADPIQLPVPVAKAALSIRSTDQLNNVLEEVNVEVKSIVPDWDSGTQTWISRVSNNPASLFRHVLQGPGKAEPLSDDEIDLVKLQEWHEFCDDKKFTFNMIRDFPSSVFDTLSDVAAAGRAGLDLADGKWSVVIDQPVDITSTYINPRNSTNLEIERLFEEVPHAWRIRFPNEAENFTQDVRTVYRTGYAEENATLYSQMEFPGVTNSDHIWKLGRYYAAVAIHRPERWTVTQDFESLIARRGMRIKIAHDVMLIGLGYGRIAQLTIEGSNIISITVDQDLKMETGKSYGISIRRDIPGDVALTVLLDTIVGTSSTVIPTTPIPITDNVVIGDLISFGEFGQETEDALVLGIAPQNEFVAQITLVPYRGDEIYDADTGDIPPYVATISERVILPPIAIISVNSGSEVDTTGVGDTTTVAIEITVKPVSIEGAMIEVQQRATGTGEAYYNAEFIHKNPVTAKITGILPGEVRDYRLRWNSGSLFPGPWTNVPNNLVVGLFTPPDPLINMVIRTVSGSAIVTWDSPKLQDLITRGIVKFRHSSNIIDPTWAESNALDEVPARSLTTTLPLKDGTYLARIVDPLTGLKSDVVLLGVVQASLLTFVNVNTINEHPDFIGIHLQTIADNFVGILKLINSTFVDDYAPTVDDIHDWDSEGGIVLEGTYEFNQSIDLGIVKGVRVTTRITSLSTIVLDLIDFRTEQIDSWEDFDGFDQAEANVEIWVRFTSDNPLGSPVWSPFQKLISSEFEARAFDFEARLTTNSSSVNVHISELGIDIEELA